LFGAALASSGLGRRTTLGTTALVVGANLPDVDALSYFGGPLADLAWRRGWTHGILAIGILPVVLAGLLGLSYPAWSRHRRTPVAPPDQRQLLLLSFIAVLSHPILDTLNTYGVRWLMPFSGRWFYGDALFIVDPWAWLILAAGVIWGWRQRRASGHRRPQAARWALAVFALYAGAMWTSGLAARSAVVHAIESRAPASVERAMASPRPLTVLSRSYVAETDGEYRVGSFRWLADPQIVPGEVAIFAETRPAHPAYAIAESTLAMRRFLGWARFPTFMIEQAGEREFLVHAIDLRYARRPGEQFGAVTVRVTLPFM
jgi:inner membrane protein